MEAARDRHGWRMYRVLMLASLSCALLLSWALRAGATPGSWTTQLNPRAGIEHGDLIGVSCTARTACMAVGASFRDDPSIPLPLTERWNGVSWTVEATPRKRVPRGVLLSVSCSSGAACTAVGDSETKDGSTLHSQSAGTAVGGPSSGYPDPAQREVVTRRRSTRSRAPRSRPASPLGPTTTPMNLW